MRKLGEPCRKMSRIEKESIQNENTLHVANSEPRPEPGEEGATVAEGEESEKGEAGAERSRKSPSPAAKTANRRHARRKLKEASRI